MKKYPCRHPSLADLPPQNQHDLAAFATRLSYPAFFSSGLIAMDAARRTEDGYHVPQTLYGMI